MSEQWVEMRHPNLPDTEPVSVPMLSFKNLHVRKGWVLVGEDEQPEKPPTKTRPKKSKANPTNKSGS